MFPETTGRRADPPDVGADQLGMIAAWQHEMPVIGLYALEIVHHQVAAVRLDGRLELLDRRQQVGQVRRTIRGTDDNPTVPQAIGNLGDDAGALIVRS